MARAVRLRVPASSANLGPGFDVLALALDLQLWVFGREAPQTRVRWLGEGAREVPLDETNLIVRAAEEPFRGWARPLEGLELTVGSKIPIGRGLGSSAAAIAAGVLLGARLRGLRLTTQRALELAFPLGVADRASPPAGPGATRSRRCHLQYGPGRRMGDRLQPSRRSASGQRHAGPAAPTGSPPGLSLPG